MGICSPAIMEFEVVDVEEEVAFRVEEEEELVTVPSITVPEPLHFCREA